ncbi:MAG TPA: hypothetical protein V6C58_25285, partial [Allocoleopsis sp.]
RAIAFSKNNAIAIFQKSFSLFQPVLTGFSYLHCISTTLDNREAEVLDMRFLSWRANAIARYL